MNENITKARAVLDAQREAGESRQVENNLLVRAKNNPKSMRAAINATCFQCFGGTIDEMPDGGWKKSIRECTSYGCALYRFRPYQGKEVG